MTMAQLEAEFDRAMAEASLPRVNTCIHAAVKAVDNESRIRDAETVVASLQFLMGTYRRISTRFGNSDPEATKKLFRQIRVIIIKNYTGDSIAPMWLTVPVPRESMISRRDKFITAFFAEYGCVDLDSRDLAGFEEYLRNLWQEREKSKVTGHAPVELIKTTISAGAFGLLTHFLVFEAIPYIFNELLAQNLALARRHTARAALTFELIKPMPLALHPIIIEPVDKEKIELLCATVLRLEGGCNPHPSDEVFKGARALLELLGQYTLRDWELGQASTAVTHSGQ